MNWHDQNIKVYDDSAHKLAAYFSGIGSRVEDIVRGLQLAGNPIEPRVIELGCGDGRDAAEIVKRAAWYEGIDPSRGLLDIAVKKVPTASFQLADALSYEYPTSTDVIFAFASLLHVNKTDLPAVFNKASTSLREGGIFYISLKRRDAYTEEVKEDKYGSRMFYYYNPKLIQNLAGDAFETVYEDSRRFGDTDWFTIALKKKPS